MVAPITLGHTCGPAVEEMLQRSVKAQEASQKMTKMWPNKPFQPKRSQEHQWRRTPPQQQAQPRGNNWSGPRVSNVIYLGDILHVEASVAVDNHVPLRLYVDSCIATLSNNKDSEPRYAVVDKLGCLMDSKSPDNSSSFTRPALNKLRFDITAFKFQGDSRSMIYMTCTLRAVNANKPADASNKACSYQKQTYRWVSEDGSSAVCGCCDAGSCSGTPRFLTGPLPPRQSKSYRIPAEINQPNWSGKLLPKRVAPLDQAGQDPQVHVKEITIGPLTVVHVVRDHAVVLSKESLYHPLQLVEEVQDSGSSVPVLAVSAVALALSCAVLLAVFLKRCSRSSDKLLAVSS
ncbi:zona pellucida sperm-binding protein 3-like [Acipenser ruthenus]|uniref:zona pellucida sperm-binding protein 3-like n=1 Tax=Acipenser ruthenus TaxID=7906 RepID=UPI00274039C8|nr:zona pellucida sperm-binding protein 3-like [Acipenser ruthenus]